MKTLTRSNSQQRDLEAFLPENSRDEWELVTSGEWSQSPYHSGWIAYYILSTSPGTWIVKAVQRTAEMVAAVLQDAPQALTSKEAATHLYRAIAESGGSVVDVDDGDGLLD